MALVKTPGACRAECGDAHLAQRERGREKTTYATRPTLLLSRLHNFLLCASAAAAAAAGAWSFNNTGTIELKRRLGYYARCESLF
jgi:hypothetical protein